MFVVLIPLGDVQVRTVIELNWRVTGAFLQPDALRTENGNVVVETTLLVWFLGHSEIQYVVSATTNRNFSLRICQFLNNVTKTKISSKQLSAEAF